jgi:hypothetical protein
MRDKNKGGRMEKNIFAAVFIFFMFQTASVSGARADKAAGGNGKADTDYSIAYINDFHGECEIRRKGADFADAVQDLYVPLYEGDTIATDNEATIEVVFDDATVVKLDPDSRLLIRNLSRKDSSKTGLELLKGKLMAIVKKLVENEEFTVRTKMAMAAVKGTEFIIASGDDSSVGVYDGAVEVSGLDMSGNVMHKVVVKKDQETTIIKYMHYPGKISGLRKDFFRRSEIGDLRDRIKYMRELRRSGKIKKYKLERRLKRIETLRQMRKMDPEKFNALSGGEKALVNEIMKEEPYLNAEEQAEEKSEKSDDRNERLKAILEKKKQEAATEEGE